MTNLFRDKLVLNLFQDLVRIILGWCNDFVCLRELPYPLQNGWCEMSMSMKSKISVGIYKPNQMAEDCVGEIQCSM